LKERIVIETLKKAKESNCDALIFIPNKDNTEVTIAGLQYNEKGESIKGGCGDLYSILLFQGEQGNYHSFEEFQAVLVCPFTYCNRMFKESYFGVIAKATTTSDGVLNLIRNDLIKEFNLE